MDAFCIHSFFSLILQLNHDGYVCSQRKTGVVTQEGQVFHKDFQADVDQPTVDLHPVPEKPLRLFAGHDSGKRVRSPDGPDDERRNEHCVPEDNEPDPNGRASMLVARESAINGKIRNTSLCISSFSPQMSSRIILPPTTSSRMKAIQWSYAEIYPMTENPATQPSAVTPARNPPELRAMMSAD